MRMYSSFPEAINEIRRDIKEMGISIHTKSVQNIDLTGRTDHDAFELTNYTYTITSPDLKTIPLKDPTWCEIEFNERVSGIPLNPGLAWKERMQYWKQFLSERTGMFDYTYPERMSKSLNSIIKLLNQDPNTRRAFLPIFSPELDHQDWLTSRIPCSLGYWFNYRQGKLNVTYLLRSSDFGEHFNNDIYLAYKLCEWVASRANMKSGNFTHWIGSLHVFQKDVENVF